MTAMITTGSTPSAYASRVLVAGEALLCRVERDYAATVACLAGAG